LVHNRVQILLISIYPNAKISKSRICAQDQHDRSLRPNLTLGVLTNPSVTMTGATQEQRHNSGLVFNWSAFSREDPEILHK